MRRIALAALAAAIATAAVATSTAGAALGGSKPPPFNEDVEVTIVYVGIDPDTSAVEAELPERSSPKVRYKLFYGLTDDAELGITYDYDYTHVVAEDVDDDFDDDLFAFLASQGKPKPLTLFQEQYNAQRGKAFALDSAKNVWIDAPTVEDWLGDNAGRLGVDPSKPTVFFVDWYADQSGANAWRPHVYTKTDEADPDTGYNFGEIRSSRKVTAWGGTPGFRIWFYDLSAGPEAWTNNWNVDDADIDGDGAADYRLPPSWHYQPSYVHPGFGSASLSKDLGLVTRYVALNLLFTSSPLYPPYFNANRIPSTVELDLNVVEGWSNVNVSERFLQDQTVLDRVRELPAGPSIVLGSPAEQDLPFSGDWARCYQQFTQDKKLCFNDLFSAIYVPFADIFLAAARNQRSFLDTPVVGRYEAGLITFGIGMKPKTPGGLLGFADDNWVNATQSGVFSFVYPEVVPLGYGATTTNIHEYGHHSSMSHPHDGLDPATGVDYGPTGEFNYAWLGDMSHTIMSYMDLTTEFGQFDRDNSARHHAAGYAKIANEVAKLPGGDLGVAENKLWMAQMAFANHDYEGALVYAKEAYGAAVAAKGGLAAIPILEPSTWWIAGPIKPGNGRKNGKTVRTYAFDLDERHNVKRITSK
jgi:hypothetical protein